MNSMLSRTGVLLYTSINECDEGDPSKKMLGCIVPHEPGLHGCVHSSLLSSSSSPKRQTNADTQEEDDDDEDGDNCHHDQQCYFCSNNPFYELYLGPVTRQMKDTTFRISCGRAAFACLPVGTKLLLRMGCKVFIICLLFSYRRWKVSNTYSLVNDRLFVPLPCQANILKIHTNKPGIALWQGIFLCVLIVVDCFFHSLCQTNTEEESARAASASMKTAIQCPW